jgi:hypothetical protein
VARKKNKERNNMLSHKQTLPRQQRLQSAKQWLVSYKGRHIVKAYARRNHVDLVCAIKELRMLGVTVTEEYEAAVMRSAADRIAQKKKKQEALLVEMNAGRGIEQDENFAFIIGYTSNGAPYGIRWDELTEEEKGVGTGLSLGK